MSAALPNLFDRDVEFGGDRLQQAVKPLGVRHRRLQIWRERGLVRIKALCRQICNLRCLTPNLLTPTPVRPDVTSGTISVAAAA